MFNMDKGKGKKPLINTEEDGHRDFLQRLMNRRNQLNISSPTSSRNPTQNNMLLTNAAATAMRFGLYSSSSSSSSSSGSSSSNGESAEKESPEAADENNSFFKFLTVGNGDSTVPNLAIDGLSPNLAPHDYLDLTVVPPIQMGVRQPAAAARKPAPIKKTMCSEELAELAMQDPKKANRIIANRMSAVRAKEKKKLYVHMLEHKMQSLHSESISLKAHLSLLQTENTGLTSENVSLKEQTKMVLHQIHLQDSLNEEVRNEIMHLKILAQMNSTSGMLFTSSTANSTTNNPVMEHAPLSSCTQLLHVQSSHQVDQFLADGFFQMNLVGQHYPWQEAHPDDDDDYDDQQLQHSSQSQQMMMQHKQQHQDQEKHQEELPLHYLQQQEEIPPFFRHQDPDIANANLSPPQGDDEDSSD